MTSLFELEYVRIPLLGIASNLGYLLRKLQYGPDAVSFQIAQVGDDRKAEEFLAALDAHPKVGGLIDSTGNFELESAQMKRMTGQDMDPTLWLCKMLLGPIDS